MALGFAVAGKGTAPAALRDSAPTQERAPDRIARGTRPQPQQDADDFESEVATVALAKATDIPTRPLSPRVLLAARADQPRRAASNGGVLAPEAFDQTRALSPRAAIQLARRTASSPPDRESLASTEPFEREVSTVAILDIDDVSIVEPSIPPHERARPIGGALASAKGGEEIGPYLLHERIGSGGMGSVHRAELRGIAGFRKSIAVKRMWPHLATDAHLVKSFIQEARLASLLRHHNIAQAYDFGKLDGSYFIAMELVEGPTLAAAIKQANRAAGAIPIAVTIDILIQLCEALEYAHGLADEAGRPLGIVHRDVSPANMVLSEGGIVKLIDFGVAKSERSQIHTEAGVIKGKLAYVAPEYTHGQLDARADLWGLGVIAYELLTGQRLFIGEHDFETLRNVREKPIYAPSRINPQIGRDLDDIVLTALERDPDRRWQSAGALRNALCNVARDLRLVLGGQAIREWVAWAFAQEPHRDTKIVRMLHALDATTPSPAQERIEKLREARSRRNAEPVAVAVATPPEAAPPEPPPVLTTTKVAPATPFARSRVLEQRASSGAGWWLLLLATIAGFVALAISQGWISEDTLVHLANRVDRLRSAF